MNDEFKASLQKKIIDKKSSASSKYSALVTGKKSLWFLLKYELIILGCAWVPGALGYFLRKIFYPQLLRYTGRGVIFGRNVTLRHPHKITIGDYSVIDDNAVLDAKGENNRGIWIGKSVYIGRNTILSCKEGSIKLQDYCNISANCSLLSETEIHLGRYCFLAGNCYLVAGGNHSFKQLDTPIMFQPSFSRGGIKIYTDVWLGAGVIILDGCQVGKGSVIGAGAVVTDSLPSYSIAVGMPAKKIRDRTATKNEPQA